MAPMQLAEINIATAIDELDSDTLAEFVSRIDEINTLAEQAPGFVWRLTGEQDESVAVAEAAQAAALAAALAPAPQPVFPNPRTIVTVSVWDSIESLKHFVFKTAHLELMRKKADWFKRPTEAHLAMWWVPAGTQPTEREAADRLAHLISHGPSEHAFTFAQPWPAPMENSNAV